MVLLYVTYILIVKSIMTVMAKKTGMAITIISAITMDRKARRRVRPPKISV
jgi:hypothetical protein